MEFAVIMLNLFWSHNNIYMKKNVAVANSAKKKKSTDQFKAL